MSEEQAKPLTLLQRINEVRKEVAYIQKQKKVDNQYYVVTHDQVTGELRDSLIKHGVLIYPPSVMRSQMVDTGTKTAKGVPFMRYEATFQITFVNVDDRQDAVSMTIEAHAIDQGDKAPGKAMSYATKTAMLKMFNIETGEDEESRHADVVPVLSAERRKEWQTQVADCKTSAALQKLWQTISAECVEAKDETAYAEIKIVVTKRASELRPKKEPAKKGSDAPVGNES